MVKVVLACDGVSEAEGVQAALDIAREFNEVRTPRYTNASCKFDHRQAGPELRQMTAGMLTA